MKNNKGYTLIELITVIAIMVILTGTVAISTQVIRGYYAKQCAKNVEAQMNRVQILNMARKTTELEIGQGTDGGYYAQVTENIGTPKERVERKQIGRKSLTITYSMDEKDNNVFELKNGLTSNPIKIQFSRSTGELLLKDKSDNAIGCHRIWIRQNVGGKYYTVTVNALTGKIEVTADMVKYQGS